MEEKKLVIHSMRINQGSHDGEQVWRFLPRDTGTHQLTAQGNGIHMPVHTQAPSIAKLQLQPTEPEADG